MLKPRNALLLLALLLLGLAAPSACAAAPAQQAAREEVFTFAGWAGPPLRVFALRPAAAGENAPVVFVMHGVRRDADRYFADWRGLAQTHGFVLVTPEFSQAAFPGADSYNLGGVLDAQGRATPRAAWAYAAIEPLFDAVRARFGLTSATYVLYGHSAGAQFAHRFALLRQGPRARMIIAANAGWYTFPTAAAWPYGFAGLPQGVADPPAALPAALAARLVVLAGEADVDPAHPSLRRSPEADAQGPHRFARALAFYEAGRQAAAQSGAVFGWACVTAPGVDHDDAKASRFAVALIKARPPAPGAPCGRM